MPTPALLTIPRFASDAAGLERSLRLFQALAQIAIAYAFSPLDAAPWVIARKQLALGRRYLRFFRFIDAYAKAYAVFGKRSVGAGAGGSVLEMVEFVKWSCLGTYLALESCTLLHAMDILQSPLEASILLSANKFWFYALLSSLLSSILQLFHLVTSSPIPPAGSASAEKPSHEKTTSSKAPKEEIQAQDATGVEDEGTRRERRGKRQVLMKKIVTDAADLLIPGSITGWLSTSPATVGWATVVSTVLSSEEIWVRVRRGAGR